MDKKHYKSISLLVILVALTGIYFIVNNDKKISYTDNSLKTKLIDLSNLKNIEVNNLFQETQHKLVLKNGEWWVDGDQQFKADQQPVRELLALTDLLSKNTVVSENQEKNDLFGFGDKRGTEIKYYDQGGDLLMSLVLGKPTLDGVNTYVKYEGDGKVYLEYGNIPFLVSGVDFRDLSLIDYQPEIIESFKINNLFINSSDSTGWEVSGLDADTTDDGAISRYLNDLYNIEADDVMYDDGSIDFSNTDLLEIYSSGGLAINRIEIVPTGSGIYYLKSSDRKDKLYIISGYLYERLIKRMEYFKIGADEDL